MGSESRLKIGRETSALRRPAWVAVLCLALGASYALAQTNPQGSEPKPKDAPKATPKTEPGAKPETTPKAEPEAKPEVTPKAAPKPKRKARPKPAAKGKAKAKGGCGKDKRKDGSLGQDPNASWVCEQQTVTLDPVWQGKKLVFAFEIRNEGTADRKINARGG